MGQDSRLVTVSLEAGIDEISIIYKNCTLEIRFYVGMLNIVFI